MSLATTCPNCGTCFRVVQDQLRVSEGWVRCGHCQQVFNALESLFDLDAPQEPVGLPPTASDTGRGVWQTEASTRWMRRRDRSARPGSGESDDSIANQPAPGAAEPQPPLFPAEHAHLASSWRHAEQEEPLSDDMLAALRAAASEASTDDADTTDGRPETADDAPDDVAAAEAAAEDPYEPASTPPPAAAAAVAAGIEGEPQPAPLDDEAGSETAFAPFPVSEAAHRESVFAPTRYEPHGFDSTGIEPAPPAALAPAAEDDAPPPAPEEGPPSATMFLSEAESNELAPPSFDAAAPIGEPASVFTEEPLEAALPPGLEEPSLPSFLAAAERRGQWDRPAARWAFGAVAGLLIAGLAAQVAWHWRERLAMAVPVTAQPLALLCQWAGCELGPPREIASLLVDNTALTRPPGSIGYRLTVQLHNTASHPVAAPAFDLVLTDAQGAVVARRTLQPADFDFHDTALAASAEVQWSTEFTLAEGNLVGYTVAAFYP